MAGLVPAIHVLGSHREDDMDARHKAKHDEDHLRASGIARAALRKWQDTIAAARL
jgi:hypothetical protein